MSEGSKRARNFFLNEHHELSREERAGGGSALKLAPINWQQKRVAIGSSINDVQLALRKSKDPARRYRYYVQVDAEPNVVKESSSIGKPPKYNEPVDYGGAQHARIISRLGLDVVDVTQAGSAIVHVTPEGFDRMASLVARLDTLGKIDQSRWAFVRGFSSIPSEQRVDYGWLESLGKSKSAESVVELQPLLRRSEADEVIRAIVEVVGDRDEKISAAGTDFSGRMWLRGMLRARTLERIAALFFSVQSIHEPLRTSMALASKKPLRKPQRERQLRPTPMLPGPSVTLPSVGVVDCGIPDSHVVLAAHSRGTFQHPDCQPGWLGSHGSIIASRIVFGDPDYHAGLGPLPRPLARYLDVRVAVTSSQVDDKSVVSAIEQCINAYPDVRVYNLSFSDSTPLAGYEEVLRREKTRIVQDLDNLAFARDVLIVVAAGNSTVGQVPRSQYPKNHQDPDWGLGHWACSFNGLTCGSFVDSPRPSGLAAVAGAPSPFCRVGPGIHNTFVPDLSAAGGDVTSGYRRAPGLGVFGCNAQGDWEDHSGTSFAAPLLARECARALDVVKAVCPQGTQPSAALAKAFLALTAVERTLPSQFEELAARTLGRGEASIARLLSPDASCATFLWQGTLESSKDLARVTIPVPLGWVRASNQPVLDLVVAWDTPVNAALINAYACRNVVTRLRAVADGDAARPLHAKQAVVPGYPLMSRRYDLKRALARSEAKGETVSDLWMLELFYEELAQYCPGLDFTPEQRVGIAFALSDAAAKRVSPQSYVLAMPIAATMMRLSAATVPVRAPVVVTTR